MYLVVIQSPEKNEKKNISRSLICILTSWSIESHFFKAKNTFEDVKYLCPFCSAIFFFFFYNDIIFSAFLQCAVFGAPCS